MVGRTGRVLSWHIFGRRGGRIDRGIIGNLLAWKSSRLEIFSGLTALSSSSNFCDF